MSLESAIDYMPIDKFKAFVANGQDVNAIGKSGDLPLLYAVVYEEKFNLLLDAGACIDGKNDKGETILMRAIRLDYGLKIIKRIIEKGANVNVVDNDGNTALMRLICSDEYDENFMNYIASSGCDITIENKQGRNAFELAIKHQNTISSQLVACAVTIIGLEITCFSVIEKYLKYLYPVEHLRAVASILRKELVDLMSETETEQTRAKTRLDNPLTESRYILKLPYHCVLDGVTRFIEEISSDLFFHVSRAELQREYDQIALVVKALALVIHTRPRGRVEAEELAERESKRFKK